MATPNLDYLHLRLANALNDTVAAASTAGNILSVAQRTDFLLRAKLSFIQEMCNTIKDKSAIKTILQSVLKTQSVIISSSGVTVNSDYINIPMGLYIASNTRNFIYHPSKEELDNTGNFDLDDAYVVTGGKIYVYQDAVLLNTGTATFYYISGDHTSTAGVPITQNGATDISLSQEYWDEVVRRALILVSTELGDSESVQVNK